MPHTPQTYYQTIYQGYVPLVHQATPYAPYHQQFGRGQSLQSPQMFGGYGSYGQQTPIPMGAYGKPAYPMAMPPQMQATHQAPTRPPAQRESKVERTKGKVKVTRYSEAREEVDAQSWNTLSISELQDLLQAKRAEEAERLDEETSDKSSVESSQRRTQKTQKRIAHPTLTVAANGQAGGQAGGRLLERSSRRRWTSSNSGSTP